jgi:hypothetical protein
MRNGQRWRERRNRANCGRQRKPDVVKQQAIRMMSREERQQMIKNLHKTVIRLPSFDEVKDDPVMYAHASRVFIWKRIPAMPKRCDKAR